MPRGGAEMARSDVGPVLVVYRCSCGAEMQAFLNARIRCKCGQVMETTQAVAIGRETAVLSAKSRPEKAVFNEFHAEKRSL